ncbi:MAG: hypothetical protein ACRCZ0_11505 [Cetobacterium sp.]
MKYRDNIKESIKTMIENKLGLPVKTSYLDEVEPKNVLTYPKLLFKENVGEGLRVIDLDVYDRTGKEVEPELLDIVGLFVCTNNVSSEIIDYTDNVIVLKKPINLSMVEYMSELTIQGDTHITEGVDDYFFISSLFSRVRRLNGSTTEHYRRFEIGIFCRGDEDESKSNYYTTELGGIFDKDFVIFGEDNVDTGEIAYIVDSIKFDVVEQGKQDRLIYGSFMVRTYK